jgi:6-phosphofructokinase
LKCGFPECLLNADDGITDMTDNQPTLTNRTERRTMPRGKVLVAQGGGPTAVINQSMAGVVLEARKFRNVELVYGAYHGVSGIIDEEFLDLTQETSHNIEMVASTPSSALGSTRDKPDLKYCQEIFKVLKAHDIGYFFYIGGNDSSDTVRIVSQEARRADYPLRCIHIPKTIDNDLVGNDHTPGFPSAARFVAQAFMGANLDNAALPGVYLGVVMGRHAGFLTAAAALGKKFPDDGPHLIYLPERTFSVEKFLADVKAAYDKNGRCVIAASEGIHDSQGTPIITQLTTHVERDAHGNVQLSGTGALADLLCDEIKDKLGIKRVRGDTFGYLQRSFIGCVSDVDQREAREVGEKAVQYAMWGDRDGSVAIKRTGFYSVDYQLVPLESVAGKTRVMEDEFIAAGGTDVTDAFRMYLRPLLGSGLPDAYRLRLNKVAKILNPGK